MEDEQGAVGQDNGGGVSASPLSGYLPSENLVENTGCDNRVEESCEEGDGEEIMVEIVGSDVLVDGVSSHKESHSELGEVGVLEGQAVEKMEESQARNFSEAMDIPKEGDENKVGERDLGLSESKDGEHLVDTEKVATSLNKSVDVEGDAVGASPSRRDDIMDDEVWNPGIEGMDVSSSAVSGPSPMVISEETKTEDAAVTTDGSDLVNPVIDERADCEEEKELLPSTDDSASHGHSSPAASLQTEEVTTPSPMVISEEKRTEDEVITKEGSNMVIPEPLNHSAEAVFDEKAVIEETKEVLPSSDNSAGHGLVSSAISVLTEDIKGPSPIVISEEKRTEGEAVIKDGVELVTPESLNHPAEAVIEDEKEELPSSDNSASHGHFSSEVSVPTEEVTGLSPMVISEEKRTEDEAIAEDGNSLVTPEPLNHPAEAALDEKANVDEEEKEVSPRVPTEDVTRPSPVVFSDEKRTGDKVVAEDGAPLMTPEPSNHPAEAVIEEKQEVLPSSDNSGNRDDFDADSLMSPEETKASQGGLEPAKVSLNPNCVDPQILKSDVIDSVVGEVHLVNASVEGELIDSDTQGDGGFRIKDERTSANGGGSILDKSVDVKEVIAPESASDALVSDLQDKNLCCSDKFHDVKLESNNQIDGVSHADPESNHDNSIGSERGEAIGNIGCLRTDEDLKTHKAHGNQVFSNEPIQLADGGDTNIVDEDRENEPNTLNMSCPTDKEIVQADSGIYSNQPDIATTLGAEIDGQDVLMSQVEVVDGSGSGRKGEDINSDISKKSLECHGSSEIPAPDGSAEITRLPEEGAGSKAESADVRVIDELAVCHSLIVNSDMKQEDSVKISETSNHEVELIGNINFIPNEVTTGAAGSDVTQVFTLPERIEQVESLVHSTDISSHDGGDIEKNPEFDMASPSDEVHKLREEDDVSGESNGFCIVEGHTSENEAMDVNEESESDGEQEVDAELEAAEPSSETDRLLPNEETVKCVSSLRMNQSGYLKSPENEDPFAESDLVWGKVRSHPWWPGQIFDPADASEKAVKYHKKDSYLVAYFGDQTFAWNDSSALKPFRSHFSQIEKQSSSEAFQNAVSCALEEVKRRVELGLACSCIPKDAYAKIETQVVENTGIREEASQRYGVDRSSQASHFEPDKLLEYVTGLAPCASSRPDRLDLVITRAQLSAFCRFKGYRSLTEFPSSGELLEIDADTEHTTDDKTGYTPKDGSQSRNERSLTELMGDGEYSPDAEYELFDEDLEKSVSLSSGKKRKVLDPPADGPDKRISVHAAKISTSATQTPKPSFKIGECIRRVASQLTGSTSSVKGSNDEILIDGSPNTSEHSEKQSVVVSAESLSVNEMLSQLELVAKDPKKRHNIQNNIRALFLGFRSSVTINRRGRKKKSEQTVGGSGEEFEFDDVNDSYWTDRIVQNYSEEQLLHERENGGGNLHLVPCSGGKPLKAGRKSHSRKRYSTGLSPTASTEAEENAKRRKQESSPAELILNFAERKSVPSEINLNKMFRRFGPLMESETEVDHESGCAKVIFKKGSDAEVALNSAEKFNIFGPVVVNYQIGYSPVISVKILPVALPQLQDDATMML